MSGSEINSDLSPLGNTRYRYDLLSQGDFCTISSIWFADVLDWTTFNAAGAEKEKRLHGAPLNSERDEKSAENAFMRSCYNEHKLRHHTWKSFCLKKHRHQL